jgi:autotransporter strand-loop-strand O-heptosyltransferase
LDLDPTEVERQVTSASPDVLPTTTKQAGEKRAYPPPAAKPTQVGPLGIRFDFNLGARVTLPDGKPWRVRLRDMDTGNILFESSPGANFVNSSKRYYVRMGVEVFDGEGVIFQHDYDAAGEKILIQLPVGTLGDSIGWFPYAVKFQEQHGCKLTCAIAAVLIPLFKDAYPQIEFVTHEQIKPEHFYATYCLGLFFDDEDHIWQPCDFRLVGLHRTAGYILGVDPEETPPRLGVADEGPPISEPYVCIAAQSTTQSKYWNNPFAGVKSSVFSKRAAIACSASIRSRPTARGSSGTTSRTAPRTSPATGRWPSACAGCAMPKPLSVFPAVCPGWPGPAVFRW